MINYTPGLVSFILPTYNRGESFLRNKIHNICQQIYENWELYVIDDGSQDNTYDIYIELLDKYSDKRIYYDCLVSNSRFPSIPRNIGICKSKGEYIAHIDDDSICEPNKLALLVNLLLDKEKIVAFGQRANYDLRLQKYTELTNIINYNPFNGTGLDTGQFIYRREIYNKIPLVFAKNACDWELLKKIYSIAPNSFISTSKLVTRYLYHDSNRSHLNRIWERTIVEPKKYEYIFKKFEKDYKINLDPV